MKYANLTADIDDSTQYATVYEGGDMLTGKPVATLVRRRVYADGPVWRVYDLNGVEIGAGFNFARRAMRAAHDAFRLDRYSPIDPAGAARELAEYRG